MAACLHQPSHVLCCSCSAHAVQAADSHLLACTACRWCPKPSSVSLSPCPPTHTSTYAPGQHLSHTPQRRPPPCPPSLPQVVPNPSSIFLSDRDLAPNVSSAVAGVARGLGVRAGMRWSGSRCGSCRRRERQRQRQQVQLLQAARTPAAAGAAACNGSGSGSRCSCRQRSVATIVVLTRHQPAPTILHVLHLPWLAGFTPVCRAMR